MIKNPYYKDWADALLCAAASGDNQAASLYPIANWLALGGEATDTDLIALTDYIEWVETLNAT